MRSIILVSPAKGVIKFLLPNATCFMLSAETIRLIEGQKTAVFIGLRKPFPLKLRCGSSGLGGVKQKNCLQRSAADYGDARGSDEYKRRTSEETGFGTFVCCPSGHKAWSRRDCRASYLSMLGGGREERSREQPVPEDKGERGTYNERYARKRLPLRDLTAGCPATWTGLLLREGDSSIIIRDIKTSARAVDVPGGLQSA